MIAQRRLSIRAKSRKPSQSRAEDSASCSVMLGDAGRMITTSDCTGEERSAQDAEQHAIDDDNQRGRRHCTAAWVHRPH